MEVSRALASLLVPALLALLLQTAANVSVAGQQLLVNGGFETGDLTGWDRNRSSDGTDVSDSLYIQGFGLFVYPLVPNVKTVSFPAPPVGNKALAFGNTDASRGGRIAQVFQTSEGTKYELYFKLAVAPATTTVPNSDPSASCNVYFTQNSATNGGPYFEYVYVGGLHPTAPTTFQQIGPLHFEAVGTESRAVLHISCESDTFVFIDDISLTASANAPPVPTSTPPSQSPCLDGFPTLNASIGKVLPAQPPPCYSSCSRDILSPPENGQLQQGLNASPIQPGTRLVLPPNSNIYDCCSWCAQAGLAHCEVFNYIPGPAGRGGDCIFLVAASCSTVEQSVVYKPLPNRLSPDLPYINLNSYALSPLSCPSGSPPPTTLAPATGSNPAAPEPLPNVPNSTEVSAPIAPALTALAPNFPSPTTTAPAATLSAAPNVPASTAPTSAPTTSVPAPNGFTPTAPTPAASPTTLNPNAPDPTASAPTTLAPNFPTPTTTAPTATLAAAPNGLAPTAPTPAASTPSATAPTALTPTAPAPIAPAPTNPAPTTFNSTSAPPYTPRQGGICDSLSKFPNQCFDPAGVFYVCCDVESCGPTVNGLPSCTSGKYEPNSTAVPTPTPAPTATISNGPTPTGTAGPSPTVSSAQSTNSTCDAYSSTPYQCFDAAGDAFACCSSPCLSPPPSVASCGAVPPSG